MILDTSFVLDLWAGEPEAAAKAREMDARGDLVYLPTPTLFEPWEGATRSSRPREEILKNRDFAASHEILPFGNADAREAGLLSGELSRAGRMMGTVDVQVASMAKARSETLLTADRHFQAWASQIRVEKCP